MLHKMIFFGVLGAYSLSSCTGTQGGEEEKVAAPAEFYDCDAAEEFSYAYSYLTDKSGLHTSRNTAYQLAQQVARGCHDAAHRFVKVTELLRRSGLSGADAASIGKDFAHGSNEQAEAFVRIFKMAFLQTYLDLDMQTSLDLARELSLDFAGDVDQALDDFEKLVPYCLETGGLNLPRPSCARLARQVVKYGEASQLAAFGPFETGFEFLTRSDEGPKIPLKEAIKVLYEVMAVSPAAVTTLIEAYQFALDPGGLKLSRNQALHHARRLAPLTYWKKGAQKSVDHPSDAMRKTVLATDAG